MNIKLKFPHRDSHFHQGFEDYEDGGWQENAVDAGQEDEEEEEEDA